MTLSIWIQILVNAFQEKKRKKTEEKSALEFSSLHSRPFQEPRSTFLLSRLGANQHHINGLNCSPFV